MSQEQAASLEENLDPQDWESLRALGHRAMDDMLDYLRTVRERPPWQHAPDQVKASLHQPLPLDPQPIEEIYEEFLDNVLPYPVGNTHPRFWGWVFGTGTATGALAEFLAGTMNTNSGDLDHHSAVHVETQVIDWFKEILGFPLSASGQLTSGCSAANLIGLAVARNAKAPFDVRREGLQAAAQRMVLYGSEEVHSSVQKAVELLGLGSDALRRVPVDADFQIDTTALRAAIEQDRAQDYLPFCVVGAAGTTNTGAVDDLNDLADLCAQEDLWFHVDAAFGAWLVLAPEARDKVAGLERADSLAFDLHKWMYVQYEIGCVLVQHEEAHRRTFALHPAYLGRQGNGRGLTGGDLTWLTDYGYELSRTFRALKAWMSLKEHGLRKYGRLIQQNIDQTHYLAQQVEVASELELLAPAPLNVVCFRYLAPGMDGDALDALNKSILVELQEQGIAVLSGTTIGASFALRACNTNHRSRREDFDLLLRETIRLGQELTIAGKAKA